jgi:hypothetical protein
VTSAAAAGADDVVGDVGLVLTLPRLVVGGTAIRATRPFAFAKCAVQESKLTKLVPSVKKLKQ